MKIALFCFSGSGNSKIVAEEYKKSIISLGMEADLMLIESYLEEEQVDVSSYDKIGFFYPIHGFSAPKIVRKFAHKLVSKKKTPYFVVMVSGEPINLNHCSSIRLNNILHKNFILESEFHYVLGYNMIFRHTEDRAFKMYDALRKIVPLDTKEYLVDHTIFKLKKPWWGYIAAPVISIQFLFYPINGKFFKINQDKCIKCMKCVNNCPVHNIEFKDGKFHFNSKCMMCTRCSFNCPTDAFNIAVLNFWRVNKPYAYKELNLNEEDKHAKYCHKAYKRYFDEIDRRLEAANK